MIKGGKMKTGGMFCILTRVKGGKDPRPWARLRFRPAITTEIKKGGFKAVRVVPDYIPSGHLVYFFSLKLEWSPEENPGRGWRKFQIDREGGTRVFISEKIGIPPETLERILSLSPDLRRGFVVWLSPREMLLRFGLPKDFFSPEPPKKEHRQKRRLLGPCSLRKLRPGVFVLAFLNEAAKKMESLQGLSLLETTKRSWLFEGKRGCSFLCPSCQHFDCYVLYLSKKGRPERHIYVTDLVVGHLALGPKPKRGAVWETNHGLILVEFPSPHPQPGVGSSNPTPIFFDKS